MNTFNCIDRLRVGFWQGRLLMTTDIACSW